MMIMMLLLLLMNGCNDVYVCGERERERERCERVVRGMSVCV